MQKNSLNICLVSQEYPPETGWGGIGSYVCEMARALTDSGHRVVVLARAVDKESRVERGGVTIIRILPPWNMGGIRLFWRFQRYLNGYRYAVARHLEQIIQEFEIDVIEAPEIYADLLWYQLFHRNRPATVIKLHTPRWLVDQLSNNSTGFWNRLEYLAERESIRRADMVMSCSQALLAKCDVYLPQCDNRVIYNPIRNDVPALIAEESTEHEVLFSGRLEWRKGVQIFPEVIPKVLHGLPLTRFVFLGADSQLPDKNSMQKHICEGLPSIIMNNLHFTGGVTRNEVFAHLSRRPVCVFPSLWENFPYACLEAMAYGCAVIGSRNGGMAEMIEDGVSGFLVDPQDAEGIAERLLLLLRDETRRRAMGAAAAQRVREHFSAKVIAEQTLAVYREAIARHGRRGCC